MKTLSETEFLSEFNKVKEHIINAFEMIDPNEEYFELEYNDEIIKIITKLGIFIINRHRIVKEIWYASPISGPSHFAYQDEKWSNTKNKEDFFQILTNDFSKIKKITLKYCT